MKIALFVVAFLFWLLLTWSLEPVSLLAGLAVALITLVFFSRHFFSPTRKMLQPIRYIKLLQFILVFTVECIKANFDVALRVIKPGMPIQPAIIKMPLSVESEFARTMLACTLTMTPGTIVLDISDNHMFVHWIYVDKKDPESYALAKTARFEKFIKIIFD